MHNPESVLDTNRSSNLGQVTKPSDSQQKRELADCRVKIKESKKRNKDIDLARGLKKLWNIKVMVIPIVSGALGTTPKGLVKGLEDLEMRGKVEIIQTTALRSARILKRALETEDLLSLKL